MWETLFFWIFAIGAVLSSLAVVLIPRNPVYNALSLILGFFFFAGLYGLLSAHFLAVTQVLVYGGAIMVVFMFIIMLLNLRDTNEGAIRVQVHHVVAVAATFAFLGLIVGSLSGLVDTSAVEAGRAEAAEATAVAEKSATEGKIVEPVAIQTYTAVPGLYGDLNEAGLNARYQSVLSSYVHNDIRPADGQRLEYTDRIYPKYREFDRGVPVEVPPELLRSPDKDVADRAGDPFGTIEPLSVLLVNRFVVSFELTAILLLAAVIGAFIIAKKRL